LAASSAAEPRALRRVLMRADWTGLMRVPAVELVVREQAV
jgi:hypothetical protein